MPIRGSATGSSSRCSAAPVTARWFELVTTATRAGTGSPAFGNGPNVRLHGETSGTYDGGQSQIFNKRLRRTIGCEDCDGECVRASGTLVIAYQVEVTIRMPDVPDGLTSCQERRVRAFLRDVLGPHEQDHARRLRSYNGTTRRAFDMAVCGAEAVSARLQEMHDSEAEARANRAEASSASIDPFERDIDLDCE